MKYLIGNHKMNLSEAELKSYFKNLKKIAKNSSNFVGVCVPYVYLPLANKMCKNTKIHFGAQNMFYEKNGAFTGEISADMLKDFNTEMVIIGHSERRNIFKETDELVNKKVLSALANNLKPIICVGETKEERENKQTNKVLKTQIKKALANVEAQSLNQIIFAYEPVWAIGTGVSATVEVAEKTIKFIKETIAKMYDLQDLNKIIVLYGGSLNEKNGFELLSQPHIDGGLIGGASLTTEKFEKIINIKI